MVSKELTDEQVEQIDFVHNVAYNAMCDLLGNTALRISRLHGGSNLDWDIEWIGEIADALCDVAVKHFGKSEMEIYPYIEE